MAAPSASKISSVKKIASVSGASNVRVARLKPSVKVARPEPDAHPSRVSASPTKPVFLFAPNVAGFQDLLASAVNANSNILAYTNAMILTDLPQVPNAPSWYSSFVSDFSNAKSHALEWANGITPRMLAIPQTIVHADALWGSQYGLATQYVNLLIHDPSNAAAKASLASILQGMTQTLKANQQSAAQLQTDIGGFVQNLRQDASAMQGAVDNAAASIGADQRQIQQLTQAIQEMQDTISTYNKYVTASEIGIGVSIFVGVVGIAVALVTFGAGAVVIGVGVLGLGASIAGTVVYQQKIRELNAKIEQDRGEISEINQQIAALQSLTGSLNRLIGLAQSALSTVGAIIDTWQTLEQSLTAVVNDLQKADSDLTAPNFQQMLHDLQTANTDWEALQQIASPMAKINWNLSNTVVGIPNA